jgi:hypothetical protein
LGWRALDGEVAAVEVMAMAKIKGQKVLTGCRYATASELRLLDDLVLVRFVLMV